MLEKFREKLWIVKVLIPSLGTVSLIEFAGGIQEVWGGNTCDAHGLKILRQLKMPKMPYREQMSKLLAGEQEKKTIFSSVHRS